MLLAAETRLEALALALIQAGADTNLTNNNGDTALLLAAEDGLEVMASSSSLLLAA